MLAARLEPDGRLTAKLPPSAADAISYPFDGYSSGSRGSGQSRGIVEPSYLPPILAEP